MITRRDFLGTVGAIATTPALSHFSSWSASQRGGFDVRLAYHAITWSGKDLQAIEEIAAAGFRGIQLRSNTIKEYEGKPAALKDALERNKLTLVCFSSGNVRLAPAAEQETIDLHTRHARFVRDLGGLHLQVTDERPKGRAVTPEDCKRMGGILTKLGKQCADLGVTLAYHNHMNNLGEKPEEIAAVLEASDPKVVRLLLDVAHYQQGGGDPVQAVTRHKDRLSLLHFKDVVSPIPPGEPGHDGKSQYKFVELGRGRVNLPGVVNALKGISYNGWAIIELDAVPTPGGTPKESMLISKRYVEEVLRLPVGT